MRIYFDNQIMFVNHLDKIIIYSPYNHKLVRVDEKIGDIIKKIVTMKSGIWIDENAPFFEIVKAMIKHKIFYIEEEKYLHENYVQIEKALKMEYKPRIAYIHITQRCNLACTYCYNKQNLNKWKELSTEKWKEIIDKLVDKNFLELIVTGGEPFLREDLSDLLNYAKNKKLKITVLTNGTLLEKINRTMWNSLDSIIVSLDSLNIESNNETRKNSNQYRILENLENMPLEYRTKIKVRSVLTKVNIQELEKMQDYFEHLHYTYLTTMFIPNCPEEISQIPKLDFDKFESHLKNYPFQSKMISCGACYKELAINSNGDIYPCHNFIKDKFFLGNILSDNWYQNVKESRISKEIVNIDSSNIKKCQECSVRHLCGGGCRAIAYNIYGNLNAPLEFFCDYLRQEAIEKLKHIRFISKDN